MPTSQNPEYNHNQSVASIVEYGAMEKLPVCEYVGMGVSECENDTWIILSGRSELSADAQSVTHTLTHPHTHTQSVLPPGIDLNAAGLCVTTGKP